MVFILKKIRYSQIYYYTTTTSLTITTTSTLTATDNNYLLIITTNKNTTTNYSDRGDDVAMSQQRLYVFAGREFPYIRAITGRDITWLGLLRVILLMYTYTWEDV